MPGEIRKIFLPPTDFASPRGSGDVKLIFCRDARDIEFDRRLAPENGRCDRDLFHIRRDFCNGAGKTGHRTVFDADSIADLEAGGDRFCSGFHAQRLHFLIRERNGAGAGTHKSSGACDGHYNVPRFICHDHFYENITGKQLGFTFLGYAFRVSL